MKVVDAPLSSPSRHRPTQTVGFARGKASGQDGNLHHLFLENGHAQGARQGRPQRFTGQLQRLALPLPFAGLQIGVHHATLNRPWSHNRHFDDQVVKAPGPQTRQHAHLCTAFNLKDPDRVGLADHVVSGRVFGRDVGESKRLSPPFADE